jgi:catechol 2,3-dioxygenase-like lactoylglutathione lyase family enzyme
MTDMNDNPVIALQHLALEVADIDRAIAFYRSFLGMKLTERHTAGEVEAIPVELCFMRLGNRHHDLVLVNNPNKAYEKRVASPLDDTSGPPAFHHYAYECRDRDAFMQVLDQARDMGLAIVRGPVVHSPWDPRGDGSWGENESFYVLDPDNHRIEIFCNLATIDADGTYIGADGKRIEAARAEEV